MKKTHRKCDTCKNEYRVTREAQSYCSPRCRRAAAYGREFHFVVADRQLNALDAERTGMLGLTSLDGDLFDEASETEARAALSRLL